MIREPFLVGLICAAALAAPAVCHAGDKESARELLIAAKDAALSIPTVDIANSAERTIALADIAGAFCLAGDLNAAKETAAEIDEDGRMFAISRIACAQAHLGDVQAAVTTARHGPKGPVWIAFVEMARVRARANDATTARLWVDELTDSRRRSLTLLEIAEILRGQGDLADSHATVEQAHEQAKQTSANQDQMRTLLAVAVAYARLSDDANARAIFFEAGKAVREGEIGDSDEAPELTRSGFAWALAKAGYFTEAIEAAQAISADDTDDLFGIPTRDDVWRQVVVEFARAGRVGEAQSTLDRVKDPAEKARCLTAIGEAQAKSGDLASAHRSFDSASQALTEAQEESADVEVFFGLAELAQALARSGQIADAVAATKRNNSEGRTGDVMRLIVIAQLDAGDELGALETARRIKPANHRGGALREVARRATRTAARVLREGLPQENDPIVRTQVLLGQAEGLLGGPPATKPP